MLLVVCSVLNNPVATPGAVDTLTSALTSDSPAALRLLSTYVYRLPLSSEDSSTDVAVEPAPSYTSVYTGSTVPSATVTKYTWYPVAAEPVPTAGAVHESVIEDAVWYVATGAAATADDVDTRTTSLRSPRPAELRAATENSYSTPPDSPVTSKLCPEVVVVASEGASSPCTSIDTAPSALPSLRYRMYPLTSAPPASVTGAAHDRLMLVVV
jgi:hypothetical protein